MKQLGLLSILVLLVACQADETGPRPQAIRAPTIASLDEGPPSEYPFGSDTNRPGAFIGVPVPPLICQPGTTTAATYDGYLVSEADQTSLDVRLQIPTGAGPFPLVALIHGYAGSKNSSGDIASKLLEDGYAVLRYSTRGFGESWGQVNLADLSLEIADMRSVIGQVMDDPNCNLDPAKVAVTGASYGGGHSWLALLLTPSFPTPSHTRNVHIVAVAPIAPWTDLFYSLLPNGRPNASIDGFGGLKLSFVNGLYASGIREDATRLYPNYPDYFVAWHAWLNTTEPSSVDPVWLQIRDGVAGYRSIYWQRDFWDRAVHNLTPIFQVQGFTDDLFPLPEAKRMLLAIKQVESNYPITSYFGDLGHPRASNRPAEVDYVLSLIRPWLAAYLKGGTPPTPKIYAALTRPRAEDFSSSNVITLDDWSQFSTSVVSKSWQGAPRPLVNPVTFAQSGITWDPLVMEGSEELKPYTEIPPAPAIVNTSYSSYRVNANELSGGGDLTIAGQPTVTLDAFVTGRRVQLNVRLIEEADGADHLITRGTYTIDATGRVPIGRQTIVIPTYGNYWRVAANSILRLELSNVDSPYLTPSREPSTTIISAVTLDIPIR
jgi:ABC-2 type transport system ATP-binding protein